MSDSKAIVYASGLASVLATLISNPLEVLKIRQQTQGLNQPSRKTQNHRVLPSDSHHSHSLALKLQTHTHQTWMENSLKKYNGHFRASESRQKIFSNQQSSQNSTSVTQLIKQIYKNEGPRTFFNGLRYAMLQATVSNMLYFTFYERSKNILQRQNFKHEQIMIPLLASGISRFLATSLTFPLEYWKVLQSSMSGHTSKKNLQLGTSINAAYAVTIQRDVLFSCVFWSILENIKHELSQHSSLPIELINLTSGVIAGVTTATLTLPLDQVKTRKQVRTRFDVKHHHKEMSTLNHVQDILREEGLGGLFRGYKPRMMKVTVHAGLVYMFYEYLKDILIDRI